VFTIPEAGAAWPSGWSITPSPTSVFVTNSGAEAVECAIKTAAALFSLPRVSPSATRSSPSHRLVPRPHARHHRGRPATRITSRASGRRSPGFVHVKPNDLSLVEKGDHARKPAAILIEPVQGEGRLHGQ